MIPLSCISHYLHLQFVDHLCIPPSLPSVTKEVRGGREASSKGVSAHRRNTQRTGKTLVYSLMGQSTMRALYRAKSLGDSEKRINRGKYIGVGIHYTFPTNISSSNDPSHRLLPKKLVFIFCCPRCSVLKSCPPSRDL